MATTGVGYRTANDVLIEISLRLCENYVSTTLAANVSAGLQTVPLASFDNAVYAGAMLVVGTGADLEIITVVTANPETNEIQANFGFGHASGETVTAATFPSQQPTDPYFTQAEILDYLARAQNEFLSKVPAFYTIYEQNALYGNIFQSLPDTATQIDRVAISTVYIPTVSLTRTGGVVTAVTNDPSVLVVDSTFFVYVAPSSSGEGYGEGGFGEGGYGGSTFADTSFTGVFQVANVINSTTFTYNQIGPDSTTDTALIYYWVRLYEITMAELTMQNRNWRNDYANNPTAFFEDRSGLYQFGLNAPPSSNFPIEILTATRDSDTLLLTDGFLVPDVCLHYVIYKTMEYMFTKEGVRIQPMLANYCKGRFDRGVDTTNRYIDNMLAMKSGRR